VLRVVEPASAFGYERLPDGTQLFGRVPHVAPLAWLHKVYAPLTTAEINRLESHLGCRVPEVYRDWLRVANGLSLFSEGLVLDGLRTDYSRRPGVWQPYDLKLANGFERLPDADNDAFFIGSVLQAEYLLYLEKRTGTLHASSRSGAASVASWGSFAAMVKGVLALLSTVFDSQGRQVRAVELRELALTEH
jgi:SMI1/KNR4 family protein SUKH-1